MSSWLHLQSPWKQKHHYICPWWCLQKGLNKIWRPIPWVGDLDSVQRGKKAKCHCSPLCFLTADAKCPVERAPWLSWLNRLPSQQEILGSKWPVASTFSHHEELSPETVSWKKPFLFLNSYHQVFWHSNSSHPRGWPSFIPGHQKIFPTIICILILGINHWVGLKNSFVLRQMNCLKK